MQAPKMGVTGRFQQLLCSSVVLGPPMPLIMHAGDQDGVDPQSPVAQVLFNAFFSALQVFCSTLLSQKTCGEDLSGIGGRSWMRLEASIVCFSHVGGSGQMVLGAWDRNSRLPQQLPG